MLPPFVSVPGMAWIFKGSLDSLFCASGTAEGGKKREKRKCLGRITALKIAKPLIEAREIGISLTGQPGHCLAGYRQGCPSNIKSCLFHSVDTIVAYTAPSYVASKYLETEPVQSRLLVWHLEVTLGEAAKGRDEDVALRSACSGLVSNPRCCQ